jgi:hypothetical protein
MTIGSSLVRGSARSFRNTLNPSNLGSFRSSKTTCGKSVYVPARECPGAKEVVDGFDAVVRHHHLVSNVILSERPQRECFVVRIILDQQYGPKSIAVIPFRGFSRSQSKIKCSATFHVRLRPTPLRRAGE